MAFGLFSFNKSSSEQKADQYSGYSPTYRAQFEPWLLANTQKVGNFGTNLLNYGAPSQHGGEEGQYGTWGTMDQGVRALMDQARNRYSGGLASRGFLRPENQAGMISGAVASILPQLLPYQQAFGQYKYETPYRNFQAARMGLPSEQLGGEAHSVGSASGFGFTASG